MNMATRKISGRIAAAATLALLMSMPALAQDTAPGTTAGQQDQTQGPPPQGGPGGQRGAMTPERRVTMLQKQLTLTPDQTSQVRSIFEESQSKMTALRSNTSISPEDRRSQMTAMRQAENEKVVALLTPDQKTQYQAMEARRREQARQHRPTGDAPVPDQGAPPPPPAGNPQPQQ